MVYKTYWLIPDRIIYIKVEGVVHINDIIDVNDAIVQMARQVKGHPVKTIIDTQNVDHIAIKVREISKIFSTEDSKLFGLTIIITTNRFIKFLTSIFSRLTGGLFVVVSTADEAIELLQQQVDDIEIPPLPD